MLTRIKKKTIITINTTLKLREKQTKNALEILHIQILKKSLI